jgi:hypothetical protein
VLATALAATGVILPNVIGRAALKGTTPRLNSLIAQAKTLSNQIYSLSEQYR